jgi:hypothetical protein
LAPVPDAIPLVPRAIPRATARNKVATEEAAMPALVAFMNAFEGLIRIMFANNSTSLADFGLQPRLPRGSC